MPPISFLKSFIVGFEKIIYNKPKVRAKYAVSLLNTNLNKGSLVSEDAISNILEYFMSSFIITLVILRIALEIESIQYFKKHFSIGSCIVQDLKIRPRSSCILSVRQFINIVVVSLQYIHSSLRN